MCKCNANKVDRVVVKLFMVRPIISSVLTVFVLTVLLIVISYATRVFVKTTSMVVQVNLTILLVLATM